MRNPALGCAEATGIRAVMDAALRLCLVASLCAGLTGCQVVPLLVVDASAHLLDLAIGAVVNRASPRIDTGRCWASWNKGIAVTEQMGTLASPDEGTLTTVALADWRYVSMFEIYPDAEWLRAPIEGTLAVTERSVLLLPPPGTAGVRIPFDLVEGVDAQTSDVIGEPSSVIVKSCFGRVDIFTLWQGEPKAPDPEATAVAAAKMKERLATFQASADQPAQVPQ